MNPLRARTASEDRATAIGKAIAFFSDTAHVGKTAPTLELFQLFSANPQVRHLVFESATAAQKTSIFKTPLFWVAARFLCSAINRL